MRSVAALVCLLAVLGLAVPTQPARAHGRSHSYSSWEIESGGAQVRVRIPLLELTRLPFGPSARREATAELARYVQARVRITVGENACPPASPASSRTTPDGWVVYAWSMVCPTGDDWTIRSELLLEVVSAHLHFVRVALPDGTVLERVLSEASPSWEGVWTTGAEGDSSSAGASLQSMFGQSLNYIIFIFLYGEHKTIS